MSSVSIRGLAKAYANGHVAVAGIDLEIAEGEFLVLLGPSGCGKTTTLRCVAGLEDVTAGEIRIGGELVSAPDRSVPPEKRQIGMVFQSYAIWPHMSVFENVAFGLRLQGVAKREIAARVEATLDLVGLGGLSARGAGQLSGGQLQRVALARAIVPEPRILLFDEPLSNLDSKLRERMRLELRALQRRLGITSIYVTHDQQEAMVLADRIVLMRAGRIEQMDAPAPLYHRPRSLFAAGFVGLANVLDARVVDDSEGTRLRLANGASLVSADRGFTAGARVHAICRPERLRLSATATDGINCLPARLKETVFLGNLSEHVLDADGLELRAQVSPPASWTTGSALWVEIPPEALVLLPEDADIAAEAA